MLEGFRHVHVIGAGGIGTAAVAKLLLAKGVAVSGSDTHASDLTRDLERRGLRFAEGHDPSVLKGADLVVYSAAVPDTDPERAEAARLGIRQLSYPQFLGELSKGHTTIAVSGTNGKSTTTAMLGLMLEAAGMDPLVIVGSLVPGFSDGNLRLGKGRFFVVEACEYRAHMLNIHPEMVVLTNIEEDHLDYFRDLNHIRDTFQAFLDKMKGRGIVVMNADDPESRKLTASRVVRYGTKDADFIASDRRTAAGTQAVTVHQTQPAGVLGNLTLRVPGAFNVANAMAATVAAMELGVPFDVCQKVLERFPGIWRRFERVGTWNGADVISDYGHHPTAIRGTVAAAREFFPGRRVVLCFQPHQHSRTKELFDGFVDAIGEADAAVLPEIYKVEGRTEEEEKLVSGKMLADAVKAKRPSMDVRYATDLKDARAMLSVTVRPGDVLIIQGAGSVDELARNLVS